MKNVDLSKRMQNYKISHIPISIDTLETLFQNEVSQTLWEQDAREAGFPWIPIWKQGYAASLIPGKTNDSYKKKKTQRKNMAASLVYKYTSS